MGQPPGRSVLFDSTSLQELLGRSQELRARSRCLCAEAQLMTAKLRDLNDASAMLMVAFSGLKMESVSKRRRPIVHSPSRP
jgi:hypothetical protein